MLKKNILSNLNWNKTNGLIPAIIQHKISGQILMHAYMNQKSLKITLKTKKVTFFSRTKNRIWTKGETTGNFLYIKKIKTDCDNDTLLILVQPVYKTCHLNEYSCFKKTISDFTFLYLLENILDKKKNSIDSSYTYNLYKSGLKRITQKVGEEAIETIIAANDNNNKETMQETADLIYHLIVLLKMKNINLCDIIQILRKRNS
ncbi:bifunctional phosphoribosyl-AMP cyclohydrolase/phosphoribosyl-ATP diphosphatase HisIE [Enterobacteriaceae endosymbiont of Donacia thalassina]|uniref:bifunctional phosphoribosyl-AMP cyclohydrolase/phosphoribosyl-ATP diphosphatase HisIE n=1 Tax=Enterobacteriaceae endosymbiont of Donacia thalassina TaxID=2675786 RepID=UPI001448E1AB|nr:bifunctional phosphoribosyl-AMP cyclohydrolase/phosphoribosyl-ATP diphosphatase HisIE [Enterobacteriaceae endosymbiont of Donacia thalassina]QJC37239.1 bifunctional phosphoribosyl-AMP cyclohydrolase/phosphoribosyl-ATP diphosphatase HisIE [Enterobacteriaceae endosymbiont of Donacia thalassina]